MTTKPPFVQAYSVLLPKIESTILPSAQHKSSGAQSNPCAGRPPNCYHARYDSQGVTFDSERTRARAELANRGHRNRRTCGSLAWHTACTSRQRTRMLARRAFSFSFSSFAVFGTRMTALALALAQQK